MLRLSCVCDGKQLNSDEFRSVEIATFVDSSNVSLRLMEVAKWRFTFGLG